MESQEQPVKFYQTGTFTVGNRLLAENQRSVQADMHRTNSLNSGHRACQGCGEALGARYAIDAAMVATNNQLIAVNATGLPRGVLDAVSRRRPGRFRGSIRCSATRPPSHRAWPPRRGRSAAATSA